MSTETLTDAVHHFETRLRAGADGTPPEFAGYKLLGLLGKGGQGCVLRARDEVLGREVALKLTRATGDDRDLREARALAAVRHPNVVHVYAAEVVEGTVCVAMELLEGLTLGTWLASGPSADRVLDALHQVGAGLAAIHAAGLAHRDIKPANMLVNPSSGRAVLVDLGLARSEGAVGTPSWLAPEVVAGGTPDQASDQYTFGLVVRSALEQVGALGLGRRFLRRALATNPRDRWPTIAEALAKLPRRSPWRARSLAAAAVLIGSVMGASATPTACEGSLVPAWVEPLVAMDAALGLAEGGHHREAHQLFDRAWPALATVDERMAAQAAERVAAGLGATANDQEALAIAATTTAAAADIYERAGDGEAAARCRSRAAELFKGLGLSDEQIGALVGR